MFITLRTASVISQLILHSRREITFLVHQRRIWVKQGRKTQVAGLAKNGIPGLEEEIAELIKEMSNER